jgi:hypothetical protein
MVAVEVFLPEFHSVCLLSQKMSVNQEGRMNKLTVSILTGVVLYFGAGLVGAADPMLDKEAKPSLGERLTKDSVKGTLMRKEGEYYWIKDTNGKETKIHVDTSTKLDKVVTGDTVKAYITDQGHATTLQRGE